MTWRIVIIILLCSAGAADAQLLTGIIRASTGGGAVAPPTCVGAIDLSKGCALPMLGGVG
jgi:hypothetical protein